MNLKVLVRRGIEEDVQCQKFPNNTFPYMIHDITKTKTINFLKKTKSKSSLF